MVGTSGMSYQRVGPVTASARSWPFLMLPCAPGNEPHISGTVPARMLCIAGPLPWYGTWVTMMPAVIFRSSVARCGVVPTPALA